MRHFAQIWEFHIAKVATLSPPEVLKSDAHRCENVSKLTPFTLFLRDSQLSARYGGGQYVHSLVFAKSVYQLTNFFLAIEYIEEILLKTTFPNLLFQQLRILQVFLASVV